MSRISKLNSGRVQVTSPSNVSSDRYNWLSLDSAEPNLGTSGNGYVLTSNTSGSRIWTNNLSISNVTANTITANYFYGNGAFLTGLASSYGNIDVSNFLQQYTGNITAGNIVANSVLINGNITSTYFFGNGSQLSGIVTGGNVTKIINGNTNLTAYDSSNIAVTINGLANTAVFFGNNLALSGSYYGDGSKLTGIVTTGNIQFADTTITSNTDITLQTLTNGNIYLNAGGTGTVQIIGTDAVGIPSGNTAQRPTTVNIGYLRFNTEFETIEVWDGAEWIQTSGGVITSDVLNGDGVTTQFVLSANTTTTGVLVSINGTIQKPSTAYTVSNNTITFTEIPVAGDTIEVRKLAGGTISVNYGNSDVALYLPTYTGNIANLSVTNSLTVGGNLKVSNKYVPTANNSTGTAGQIVWDNNYVYVCVATDTWKRANIATW